MSKSSFASQLKASQHSDSHAPIHLVDYLQVLTARGKIDTHFYRGDGSSRRTKRRADLQVQVQQLTGLAAPIHGRTFSKPLFGRIP